jgi:hypothetical protein
MVKVTKLALERENEELRAEIAELRARQRGSSRSQSEPINSTRRPYPFVQPLSPYPPSSPVRTPSPALVQATSKDLKLDPPPEFDGKTSEYAMFIGHCEFYFLNKPATFGKNDGNKVNYVISRLRGRPSTWAHSMFRANPKNPMFLSWSLFRAELDSLYEDPLYLEQVRRDLEALKQTGSARTFSAEFKALAAILNLSPGEKIFQYKEKLKGPVRTQLAGLLSINESFDSLVQKSINVDQAMFIVEKAAKKAAKAQNPTSTSTSSASSSRPPQQYHGNPSSSSSSGGPRHPANPGTSRNSSSSGAPRTSSAPHPPLTDAEKQYREDNNLCRYCGGAHFKKDCEKWKKKLEADAKNGIVPRYSGPTSSSNINVLSSSGPPVTVSHIISPAGKFNPQSH